MKYLGNLELIEGSKYKTSLIGYDVEDRAERRKLTVEEFAKQVLDNKEGIVLDTVPDSQKIEGKTAVRCVDLDTQQVYYEYENIPISEENEIDILKKQVAELSFLVMQLQGGTN